MVWRRLIKRSGEWLEDGHILKNISGGIVMYILGHNFGHKAERFGSKVKSMDFYRIVKFKKT